MNQTGAVNTATAEIDRPTDKEEGLPPEELLSQMDLTPESGEQAKRKQLQKELHARVNPKEQTAVFEARRKQDNQEIKQLQSELSEAAKQKQIPQTQTPDILEAEVVDAGDRGNVFQGLLVQAQQLIETFSADWAETFQRKQTKVKGPIGPAARTKKVQDTFHHERATGAVGA